VRPLAWMLAAALIVCAAVANRAHALVGTLRNGRLARLDARTLQPLPSPRPLRFRLRSPPFHWVLSPDGSRVAVAGATSAVVVVDTKRWQIANVVRNEGFDASRRLTWPSNSFLVAIGDGNRFPYEYTTIYPSSASEGGSIDSAGDPVSEVREGVVVQYNANEAEIFGAMDTSIDLPGLPSDSPYPHAFAPDPRRDRVFVISGAGVVAEVDLAPQMFGLPPNVSYHQVPLNRWPVKAAWAGNGQIAVWGAGGLARIDTGDWSVHPIDADVTDVIATQHGLVTWQRGGSDGLAVYRPGGALRFRVLRGRSVGSVASLGPYAYVNAGGRFSVNLRNGRIAGPLKSRARPILPDLVGIQ
jgi:hypothetical protein